MHADKLCFRKGDIVAPRGRCSESIPHRISAVGIEEREGLYHISERLGHFASPAICHEPEHRGLVSSIEVPFPSDLDILRPPPSVTILSIEI